MMDRCHFCPATVAPELGLVDIGGLNLCVGCYESRKARTHMPCEVCGTAVSISSDPLVTGQICGACDAKADLRGAWDAAKKRLPCDKCGQVHEKWHHATCFGQNLCHDCYGKFDPCTQCYPGDRGYPAFVRDSRPSIPAVVLLSWWGGIEVTCAVCKSILDDPQDLQSRLKLPVICTGCRGPKWWDYMRDHYEELVTK